MRKSSANGVSRVEITNFLSNFKQGIINDMATQPNTLQEKKKQEEVEVMLAEYCPHCRKKKDCKCKMVANVDSKKIPSEFKGR